MNTISRFPIPSLDALPEDIRSRIVAVQEKAGFIPNVFLAWAHRPEEFRAFFAYHDALLDKPGGLSKAEREMIVVVTSAVNHCHYCVIAHGAILRIRAKAAAAGRSGRDQLPQRRPRAAAARHARLRRQSGRAFARGERRRFRGVEGTWA
jgi:uncharacterized peroxidase-related enzyme